MSENLAFLLLVSVSMGLGMFFRLLISRFKPMYEAFRDIPRFYYSEVAKNNYSNYFKTLAAMAAINSVSLLLLGVSPTILFLFAYFFTGLFKFRNERKRYKLYLGELMETLRVPELVKTLTSISEQNQSKP